MNSGRELTQAAIEEHALNLSRALKYAAIQARLRARIGKLPDRRSWGDLTVAPGQEFLEGLDDMGVGFWLDGLSSGVSSDALERHFAGRVRHLMRMIRDWLPAGWEVFGAHLAAAPDVFWLAPVLDGEDPGLRLDRDSGLHPVLRAAVGQRRGLVAKTSLGVYLDDELRPQDRWRELLTQSVPRVSAAERRPVEKLVRVLDEHFENKLAKFVEAAAPSGALGASAETGDWAGHESLERRLRLFLAGDVFHPGTILVYGILEMLTMERLRALLICRLFGWPSPTALKGAT